jgi:hypothetical protein
VNKSNLILFLGICRHVCSLIPKQDKKYNIFVQTLLQGFSDFIGQDSRIEFLKYVWRLSSFKSQMSQLASPADIIPDQLAKYIFIFLVYVLCTYPLFFCKYCKNLSSYVEVKTVCPTLNCFLVYLFCR